MTQIQAISPSPTPGNRTLKFIAFLYGSVAYLTFFWHDFSMLLASFPGPLVVPKAIDNRATSCRRSESLAINSRADVANLLFSTA